MSKLLFYENNQLQLLLILISLKSAALKLYFILYSYECHDIDLKYADVFTLHFNQIIL